jgi:C_GCAxxG_C_C family probable redox protein
MSKWLKKPLNTFKMVTTALKSVLLALYEHMEPEHKNELISKIAAGFGGGIGRCGSVCGALTGSIIAIGIKDAPNQTGVEKRASVLRSKIFLNRNSTDLPAKAF